MEEVARHKKKRAGIKKPFAIEGRPLIIIRRKEWGVWKRYKTEADRDKALKVLNEKSTVWEFRKEIAQALNLTA